MKFKVEVEIDWIDIPVDEDGYPNGEEFSLDKAIQDQLASQIASKLYSSANEQVKKVLEEIKQEHLKKIQNAVDEGVNNTIREFWEQPVNQTDRFGDVVQAFPSVREMVKSGFDKYLQESVDENGKKSDRWSNKTQTRFDYLFRQQSQDILDAKFSEVKKDLDEKVQKGLDKIETEISNTIEDRVTGELGNRMKKMLEIDTLLLGDKKD